MKLSRYYRLVSHGDGTGVLFSTFNNALIQLDERSYRFLRFFESSTLPDGSIDVESLSAHVSSAELSAFSADLASAGILLDDDVSEKNIVDFERARSMLCGAPAFCVMTTTGCNARCPYCYEKGTPVSTMSDAVAHDVAKYIISCIKPGESFDIEWFGGEPLINPSPIDIITEALEKTSLLDHARISMASNGILFDSNTIEKAATTWHLEHVQITLDGTEARHDAIKLGNGKSGAFSRTVDNIMALAEAGVYASIRVNIGPENEADIIQMLENLAPLMSGNENIGFYAYPLFSPVRAESKDTVKRIIRVTERIASLGLRSPANVYQLYYLQSRCLATNYRGATIAPDGNIYGCSHCLDERSHFGDIWHHDPYHPKRIAWSNPSLPDYCSDCILLPMCQGGCKVAELGLEAMPQCSLWKNALDEIILSAEKLNSAS